MQQVDVLHAMHFLRRLMPSNLQAILGITQNSALKHRA